MPLTRRTVGEIMGREPLRIGPDASVREVIETMIARRNGCVVVVDGEDRPLGIISERDLIPMAMAEEVPGGKLLKAILEEYILHYLRDLKKSHATTAREIMSQPPVCVEEDTSVAQAAYMMDIYSYRQLPVTRQGRLVGIVCRADIVRAVAETLPRQSN